MPKHSGQGFGESPAPENRLDPETARRILGRAAEEQDRLDSRDIGSYTLEELEQIAKEAGISPEAFHAAAARYQDATESSLPRTAVPEDEGRSGWLATLENQLPDSWSPSTKRTVLIVAGIALVSPLVLLPVSAPVAFAVGLVIVAVFLLILIGALFFL